MQRLVFDERKLAEWRRRERLDRVCRAIWRLLWWTFLIAVLCGALNLMIGGAA